MKNELAMPRGLDEAGRKAHAIILAFLKKKDLTYTGGGCKFYSPKEWARRGEPGGEEGWRSGKLKLVLVHDGGDPYVVFGMTGHREAEALFDDVTAQLGAAGVYPEQSHFCSTQFWEIPAREPTVRFGGKQDRRPPQLPAPHQPGPPTRAGKSVHAR